MKHARSATKGSRAEESPDEIYTRAREMAHRNTPGSLAKSVRILAIAARRGHAQALYYYGNCFIFGTVVHRNLKRAAELWWKAARKGHAEACYNLAVSYEEGRGVSRSERRALALYERAGLLGDASAWMEVGRMKYHGLGTRKDAAEALRCWKRAAARGIIEAAVSVGDSYEYGVGVRKNRAHAIRFYEQAALAGSHYARLRVQKLREESSQRPESAERQKRRAGVPYETKASSFTSMSEEKRNLSLRFCSPPR
jgi:TPR repeat protein